MRSYLSACLAALTLAMPAASTAAAALTAQEINDANPPEAGDARGAVAKLQIFLDRARFSPGVIDARLGENVKRALVDQI